MLARLYQQGVGKRVVIVWTTLMAALWTVFGVALVSHPDAWEGIAAVSGQQGWSFLAFILGSNGLLLLLIAAGNLFARFGSVTPGLAILLLKAAQIGWIAGTNAFDPPFSSVGAANVAFLRVGLWEATAYAVVCAVTLTKSLHIAKTFPARRWVVTRAWRDLTLTAWERVWLLIGGGCLVAAAVVEAFFRA